MRTVVINEQGTTIRAEGNSLVVESCGQKIKQVRTNNLDQLILMGRIELSSGAVALLARTAIDTVFMTSKGTYRARLVTRESHNVVLRCRQWQRAGEDAFATEFARSVVVGKLSYQRHVLLRVQREFKDEALAETLARMRVLIEQAKAASNVSSLRGYEGAGAALYFGQFGKLIRNSEFEFTGRNRRPPRDPVNAALSFCYALLLNTVETEVLRTGLDPYCGFLHEPAHGRPSMVLDLMEEFRPLMDLLILRLINRRQLARTDFEFKSGASLEAILADLGGAGEGAADDDAVWGVETGEAEQRPEQAVYLSETGRKVVLNAYYKRMRDRIFYVPRGQRLEIRQIVREQCYHLARVIEGEDSVYLPFAPR